MSISQKPQLSAVAIYKIGGTEPVEVTMNPVTIEFYKSLNFKIVPLVEAEAAVNAIVAAKAMYSIYHQCFQRGDHAKPGDKVMFDNGLIPMTPAEEHALMNVGITIGCVYTVSDVFKIKFVNNKVELAFRGSNGTRRFNASKFVILPK